MSMANLNNIIKILIIIAVILAAILIIYATTTNNVNADTLKRVNLSDTCSLELPKIDFNVDNSTNELTYNGITVGEYSKNLTSDKLCIQYSKSYDNIGTNESNISAGYSIQANNNWHTRTVFNSATGESVIISGENKELVDKIADSVVFKKVNITTNKTEDAATSSTSSSSSNNAEDNTPYAYYNGRPVTEAEYNQIYNSQPHPDIWFEYHPGAPNPHESDQGSSDSGGY